MQLIRDLEATPDETLRCFGLLDVSPSVNESARNAIIHYAGVHYERDGHLEFVHSQSYESCLE